MNDSKVRSLLLEGDRLYVDASLAICSCIAVRRL